MKLCRVLMYGMRGGGRDVGTPRVALATSIREAYKHRRKWRLNVARQPGRADEGLGQYRMDELLTMAESGRCHVANKKDICRPWAPKDRWDQLMEDDYFDTPETHYLRFVSGVVDAIEESGRWEEFKITLILGQAAAKGTEYRNAVIALACSILWAGT